jgi:hypothetical protein
MAGHDWAMAMAQATIGLSGHAGAFRFAGSETDCAAEVDREVSANVCTHHVYMYVCLLVCMFWTLCLNVCTDAMYVCMYVCMIAGRSACACPSCMHVCVVCMHVCMYVLGVMYVLLYLCM